MNFGNGLMISYFRLEITGTSIPTRVSQVLKRQSSPPTKHIYNVPNLHPQRPLRSQTLPRSTNGK